MTRPWSRYARACSLVGFWSAAGSPVGKTVSVGINGKTNISNWYGYRYATFRSTGAGCAGVYTTKRTGRNARQVARLHARLAHGQRVYLLTHTMADDWSDTMRRASFRLLLDRLRKLPGNAGQMWSTERHESGKLHHHVVMRHRGFWNYKAVVQKWSQRYCGSPNGLDVSPPRHGRAAFYATKGFAYTVKSAGTGDSLPFRWWGTSKVARKAWLPDEDCPTLFALANRSPWGSQVAYVSSVFGLECCARVTREYELKRTLTVRRVRKRRKRAKDDSALWDDRHGWNRKALTIVSHTTPLTAACGIQ